MFPEFQVAAAQGSCSKRAGTVYTRAQGSGGGQETAMLRGNLGEDTRYWLGREAEVRHEEAESEVRSSKRRAKGEGGGQKRAKGK